mmetsp:Transcript_5733/g.13021  ORF Transcript_5733/g.13021 Transcript_5733/m.13021 type:complete len:287 (-) Transcript_5733:438-1298(-)
MILVEKRGMIKKRRRMIRMVMEERVGQRIVGGVRVLLIRHLHRVHLRRRDHLLRRPAAAVTAARTTGARGDVVVPPLEGGATSVLAARPSGVERITHRRRHLRLARRIAAVSLLAVSLIVARSLEGVNDLKKRTGGVRMVIRSHLNLMLNLLKILQKLLLLQMLTNLKQETTICQWTKTNSARHKTSKRQSRAKPTLVVIVLTRIPTTLVHSPSPKANPTPTPHPPTLPRPTPMVEPSSLEKERRSRNTYNKTYASPDVVKSDIPLQKLIIMKNQALSCRVRDMHV